MKKTILFSLAILCFLAGHAQTTKKDTIQVEIAAVKIAVTADNASNHGNTSVTFNGYIVLEQDKPNIYLDSRKTAVIGYRILNAYSRKWEEN